MKKLCLLFLFVSSNSLAAEGYINDMIKMICINIYRDVPHYVCCIKIGECYDTRVSRRINELDENGAILTGEKKKFYILAQCSDDIGSLVNTY